MFRFFFGEITLRFSSFSNLKTIGVVHLIVAKKAVADFTYLKVFFLNYNFTQQSSSGTQSNSMQIYPRQFT